MKITGLSAHDVRFPTSRSLDGSDAMHQKPDYSAAYVVLHTDSGASGHGLTFTNGRGTEVCVAARTRARATRCRPHARRRSPATCAASGARSHPTTSSAGSVRRRASSISPSARSSTPCGISGRRRAGMPLWQLLTRLPPEELVAAIDFRYIEDALSPDEALDLLRAAATGKRGARGDRSSATGYPAYTTSAGWIGYERREGEGTRRGRRSLTASST